MTKNKKIFVVIADFDNAEIQESTLDNYVEEYGKSAHRDAKASIIRIVEDKNAFNSFSVKEFKNGAYNSSGKNVIDAGIAYATEQEAQEALDLFYEDYAKNNENAPCYFDNEEDAKENLAEFLES